MSSLRVRQSVALSVALALFAVTNPAWGAPASATLTGTVFGPNASAPLAGATVVVTSADGTKLASRPTGVDGAFTVQGVPPGTQTLALETKDGAFAIATPITLAPGQTRGVQLALRAASEDDKKKKKGAAAVPPSSGDIAAMVATIVGMAVIAGLAISSANDSSSTTASPSQPPPDKK
jgi:hypothetical protein